VLWSLLDPETVWAERREPDVAWRPLGPGRWVALAMGPSGRPAVVRLVSTEPRDYLDPALAPGTIWPERASPA
jgi:hypothetical protein